MPERERSRIINHAIILLYKISVYLYAQEFGKVAYLKGTTLLVDIRVGIHSWGLNETCTVYLPAVHAEDFQTFCLEFLANCALGVLSAVMMRFKYI